MAWSSDTDGSYKTKEEDRGGGEEHSRHSLHGGQERRYTFAMHRTAPTTKHYLGQNINSAAVEKPCFRKKQRGAYKNAWITKGKA